MSKIQNLRRKALLSQSTSDATLEWVLRDGVQFDTAVTLTFPNDVKDFIVAERMFGTFMCYLNERCYGRRKKEKIKVFAVQEGLHDKRNHYHCAIQCPLHLTVQEFEQRVGRVWAKVTRNSEAVFEVKEIYSKGWIGYMTKEMTQMNSTNISEHCNF